MKKYLLLIFAALQIFSGCIRHSDQGLLNRARSKSSAEKSNVKKVITNLVVKDINSSVNFYRDIVGLEPVAYYPDSININLVVLAKGNVEIMLEKKANFVEEFPEYKTSQSINPVTVLFTVNEILMIYEKAITKTNIIKELHQTPYGTKEFSIKDYDGYIITFSEPLKK
jgi:lactoylglutathione lyase